ncbi:MAG: 50S ribosomal protein L28 [Alphaproteobacteria bacterium]
MARLCKVTGKTVMTGNNVSHANNKTRRRFKPNLQEVSFFSEVLQRAVRMRVSVNGLRTIEHRGGIDSWLSSARDSLLDRRLRSMKQQIIEKNLNKASS